MSEYYENKVAVVTGAASGIGLALSELLLAFGAKAVVLADLNAEKLENERERLETIHAGKVLGCRTDVTKQESVAAMFRSAAEFGAGQIHFVFNNAGAGLTKSFDAATHADWKFAFDINFFGPLYGIRAVLPIMRAQGGGHIANTASGIGFTPMAYQSMYSSTKAALIGLTGALRYELWDENIRLSTIIPGTVNTPIWQKAGGAPDSAISPEQAAHGILEGVAANERIVIITDADRKGAINAFHPDSSKAMDEYLLYVARRRRSGETAV
jgi:NAD(P)-dependent dehydrogenase (short-subunit alcohol dehydrogenase family)